MSASRRVLASSRPVEADRPVPVALPVAAGHRGRLVHRTLVTSDVVAVLAAFLVSYVVTGPVGGGRDGWQVAAFVGVTSVALVLVAQLYGLYDRDVRHPEHSTVAEIVPIIHMVTLTTWLAFLGARVAGAAWQIDAVAVFWAAATVTIPLSRTATRAVFRRRRGYVQPTLIVGAGDVGQLVGRKLKQHPELGVQLIGFVDADPREMRADLHGIPVLGSIEETEALVERHGVERVIVAFSHERHDEMLQLVRRLQAGKVQVDVVPRLFEAVGPAVEVHSIEGLALVGLPPVRMSRIARFAKRSVDVVVASVLLLLLAPLLLVIAWRIRRDSEGPVLFRQQRLGAGMSEFAMFKFRTMATDTDDSPHREYVKEIMSTQAVPNGANIYKLERPDVVTKVGGWLRRTSLDELPQLLNVLRGDMSLVGPRPCMPYEVELFLPHHFDRFLVPAGMTGLWQVSARASSTLVEAFDLDTAYARNWSFWLDLSLLARTPLAVLRGRAATS